MANTLKFGNGEWYGKKDTILAYNDENDNYKPLPFDFSRNSFATVINKDGLIETVGSGKPRIDFKDNSKGALLLEPSRTNSLVQSNQFDTTWGNTNTTVLGGQSGVYGSSDAWKIDISSAFSQVEQTLSNNGVQTFSVYAKAGTLNWIRLRVDHSSFSGTYFDLQNGVVGSTVADINSSIEDLGDGWYRCNLSVDNNVTRVRIYPSIANNDLTATSGNIYIQHAQLESGSYSTSIIPTSGSAVTRVADVCNNGANEQVINSTEGVLYVETSALSNDLSERRFGLSDGTSSNVIRVGYTSVSNRIIAVVYNGSNQAVMTYTSSDITQNSKIAVKYKENDFALWVDGVERSTDTSGSVFSANTLNSLDFNIGGGSHFYSKTKDVRVYNIALTDQELQTLTTI